MKIQFKNKLNHRQSGNQKHPKKETTTIDQIDIILIKSNIHRNRKRTQLYTKCYGQADNGSIMTTGASHSRS